MTGASVADDKRQLRRRLRAARAAAAARAIVPHPAFLARLSRGLIVASYHPVGHEADPAPLAAAARDAGCTIALPHVVDRATPLRFVGWDGAPLVAGPFGLGQPDGGRDITPDIILTPLVGFDRRGHRLGQGAGHYDRAFAAHPLARRIGVALSVQEVEALPVDAWDVPLHAVLTETEWITTS